MTIFLWSPQIDASKQDEDMVMYYRRMIEAETGVKALRKRNSKICKDEPCIPKLRAPFTNWSAVQMIDVVEFCKANDKYEPDFIEELGRQGQIRMACSGSDAQPLNVTEQRALEKRRQQYHKENWHKVLVQILGCNKPQLACKNKITLDAL